MIQWINEEIIVLLAFLGFFILLGKQISMRAKSFLENYKKKIQEELDEVQTLSSSAIHTHANKQKELQGTDETLRTLHHEERQAIDNRLQALMNDITKQTKQKEIDINNYIEKEKKEAEAHLQEKFVSEAIANARHIIVQTINQTYHDNLIKQSIEKIAKERQ